MQSAYRKKMDRLGIDEYILPSFRYILSVSQEQGIQKISGRSRKKSVYLFFQYSLCPVWKAEHARIIGRLRRDERVAFAYSGKSEYAVSLKICVVLFYALAMGKPFY